MTDTAFGFGFFVVFLFYLWTYELHRRQATAQIGFAALPAHKQGRIIWAARDFLRNKRFFKRYL